MKRMRILILATAVVAALLAAYLATGLMRRPPAPAAPVAQKSSTTDVLTAARNLAAGERLELQWTGWPSESVSTDMITRQAMPNALEDLKSARALSALVAGEPVVSAKMLRNTDAGYMSALLPEGHRAIAIEISDLSSAGGFVLPNDRVDVIFTRQTTDTKGNKNSISEAVLSNVKVLAINQTLTAGNDGASIPDGRTAVLELTIRQAEVIARISSAGQLSLALRSALDQGDGEPKLSDAYRNPKRSSGPLVVRYGLERSFRGGQ